MNSNERPGGYLMPELAPPPAGVRPFIARRPTPPVKNPNHVAPPLPAGASRPRPEQWCYRCDAPAHDDDDAGGYTCWVPLHPMLVDQAVSMAALAARAASAVPMALASWAPEHEDLVLQVAQKLVEAVDASREARRVLAGRHLWAVGDAGEAEL